MSERIVGGGAGAAFVLWRAGEPISHNVVIFLHGWDELLTVPESYGAWIRHLAEEGSTVIYPVYMDPRTTPPEAASDAFAGVLAGLHALGFRPRTLVVAGHTTGGALAFDYAADAVNRGLPRPAGVMAVYPARNPTGESIPVADPALIAPSTRIVVVGGKGDPVVDGQAQARRMWRSAGRVPRVRRRYLAADPAANPQGSDLSARQAFWKPLDQLISVVRSQ